MRVFILLIALSVDAAAQGWPPPNGAALPATCTVGQAFWLTTTSETTLHNCTATNTWTEHDPTVTGGAPDWADITNKPTTFAPIIGSGAGDAVAGNDARLTDARTPTAHAHAIADVTNLQTGLDGKAASSHSHVDGDIPNTITIDLAAAATALASNPSDCAATQFATTIGANGNLTCAALADADVPNTITVDLAAAATALAANPADCAANQFATTIAASGALTCAALVDADVPNTITISLAATATALAANPTDCGGGQYATAIDASGNLTCGTPAGGGATTLTSSGTQSDAVIATYTAITGLSFTPAASTNYLIDCYIVYTSTAATTGINFAWDTPASPTMILMTGHTKTVATGANEGFSQNSDNVGTSTSAAVITTQNLAVLNTLFRNGSNSTAMSLGFTPETANSVSVIAGSVCQYRSFT